MERVVEGTLPCEEEDMLSRLEGEDLLEFGFFAMLEALAVSGLFHINKFLIAALNI